MSGMRTLAYLLILVGLTTSQPTQQLHQTWTVAQAVFQLLY
ncbi:MAG: hypothetical protein PVG32_09215 [Anaerolineales bacterium]